MAFVLAPNWDRPFGYPLLLAGILRISHDLSLVVVIQNLLGIATAFLWYRIAKEHMREHSVAPLILFALVGFNLESIVFERYILTECFTAFLLALYLYFHFQVAAKGKLHNLILLALNVVGLAITRTIFIIAAPLGALAIIGMSGTWRETWKKKVSYLCLFSVIVIFFLGGYSLWMKRHYGKAGLTFIDGWFLYSLVGEMTNCSEPKASEALEVLCDSNKGKDPSNFKLIWDENAPPRALLRHNGLDLLRTNDQLRKIAIQIIRKHPVEYSMAVAGNIWKTLWSEDFYWDKAYTGTQSVQKAMGHYLGPRVAALGTDDSNLFRSFRALYSLKRIVTIFFGLSLLAMMRGRLSYHSCTLVVFSLVYLLGSTMTVEGDWSRFFVPIYNVFAFISVDFLLLVFVTLRGRMAERGIAMERVGSTGRRRGPP